MYILTIEDNKILINNIPVCEMKIIESDTQELWAFKDFLSTLEYESIDRVGFREDV